MFHSSLFIFLWCVLCCTQAEDDSSQINRQTHNLAKFWIFLLCHLLLSHHLIQDWHRGNESSLLILITFIVQKSSLKKKTVESRIFKRFLDILKNSLVIPIIQRFPSFLSFLKKGKRICVQLKILINISLLLHCCPCNRLKDIRQG